MNNSRPHTAAVLRDRSSYSVVIALLLAFFALYWDTPSLRGEAVVPGNVAIGLISESFPSLPVPIDAHAADGKLFIASITGAVVSWDGSTVVPFLDLSSAPKVGFTTNFAGGLLGIAFHPDYLNESTAGFRKFYTYSTDLKTINQSGSSNVSPGNQLTGLPDFYHPEMYAPATSGDPLINWSNPNSPSSGNVDFDHFNIVREWTAAADGLAIDMSIAPREILRIAHGFAGKGSHNGGGLRFGPDGYLYLSIGDGGGNAGKDYDGSINNGEDGHTDGTGNAQDRTVIYGKVLRIDPTAINKNSANGQYGLPLDNPYVLDDSRPEYLDEIYAYGFRNPWKLSFDNLPGGDGSLYLADVGQHHREEINLVTPGGNYGWGYLEGRVRLVHEGSATGEADPSDPFDGTDGSVVRTPPEGFEAFEAEASPPLVDYLTRRQTVNGQLVGEGTAVTGGYVYRGELIPELQGMYIFGDYSIGGSPPRGMDANKARLFYLDPLAPAEIKELSFDFGEEVIGRLLGMGRDSRGELYALFDNGNVAQLIGTADRDRDGDVDGLDFLSIQREAPALTTTWSDFYGTNFLSVSNSAAIPEPQTITLTALLSSLIAFQRPKHSH